MSAYRFKQVAKEARCSIQPLSVYDFGPSAMTGALISTDNSVKNFSWCGVTQRVVLPYSYTRHSIRHVPELKPYQTRLHNQQNNYTQKRQENIYRRASNGFRQGYYNPYHIDNRCYNDNQTSKSKESSFWFSSDIDSCSTTSSSFTWSSTCNDLCSESYSSCSDSFDFSCSD